MIYSASNVRWLLNLSHAFHWRKKEEDTVSGLRAVFSRDLDYLTDRVDLLFRLLGAKAVRDGRRQDWNKFQFKLKFVFGSNAVEGARKFRRSDYNYRIHSIVYAAMMRRWRGMYRPVGCMTALPTRSTLSSLAVGIPRMSAIYQCNRNYASNHNAGKRRTNRKYLSSEMLKCIQQQICAANSWHTSDLINSTLIYMQHFRLDTALVCQRCHPDCPFVQCVCISTRENSTNA